MLKDMIEYQDIAVSEEIQLGDTITVDYMPYNIKLKKRLTGYTYNILSGTMENLEIGDFGKDYFKELSNNVDKIEIPNVEDIVGSMEEDFNQKLDDFSNSLINGGNNSYVKFKPNFQNPSEILIMDNQDESKAKSVIRLNKDGIGASTTGVTGTYYGLAKDGKLIITEATANVIVASLIKGGMLQSNDGSTWINMDNGTFNFKDKVKFENNKLTINLNDGKTVEQSISNAVDGAYGHINEQILEVKSGYTSSIEILQGKIDSSVEEVNSIKTGMTSLESTLSSNISQTAKDVTTSLTEQIKGVGGDLEEFEKTVTSYMKFDTTGLELGKTDSKFKAKLSTTKLSFLEDSTEVAYISNKKMYITDAEITNQLTIGKFAFVPRANGNTSLKWIG